MQTILLVIHIFIALALIGIILIQRSNNDGLGLSSGSSNNSFMSGRSQANLLTRVTAILAAIFMANCLLLAWLASHSAGDGSIINKVIEEQKSGSELPVEKGMPNVPLAK